MKVPKHLEERFRDQRLAEEGKKRRSTPYSGGYREAYIRNDVPSVAEVQVAEPTCSLCAYSGTRTVLYKKRKVCVSCLTAILKTQVLRFDF